MHQQRPLALGADICMYSATKYMNGNVELLEFRCRFDLRIHFQVRRSECVVLMLSFDWLTGHSDVVMGLVSVSRDDLYERLKFLQNG